MEFYWELILQDGTVYMIPPAYQAAVNKRFLAKEPIPLKTATVPYADIKAYRQTEKLFTSQRLIEDASKAFNEPVVQADGGVLSRWVKKSVPQSKWDRYYAPNGYKFLSGDGGMVTIAFRLPVHQIDASVLQYCTADEIVRLER